MRDIALSVNDAEAAWRETTRRGARSVRQPETVCDEHGEVHLAAIATYGDTVHTFVERANYSGAFLPGFRAVEGKDEVARPVGLKYVDHMVGNVGWGEMNRWVISIVTLWGSGCSSISTTRTSARSIRR